MAKKNCIKICEIHFPCARFPRKIDFKDPLVTRVAEKWYLGYGSPRGPLSRNPNKDNYESDYKQNSGSRVYLRASNWSIIPTPTTWVGSLLTHRIERRLRTTDAREPKSGALLDRFFLENARKKFHSQFTFSILSPSFVTENRPSLSFSLFSLSRELLRTFANKFLIFFPLAITENRSTDLEIPVSIVLNDDDLCF